MAGSVNKVILIGNLGRDPEVRSFPNGGKIASLRLATSETWKDRASGERKERTEWHSISIMNEGLVRVAEQYLRKGAKVYIEGQLETRKWQDQQGQDRYTTEVVLRPFSGTLTMLENAASHQRGGEYDQRPETGQGQSGGYGQSGYGAGGRPNAGRDLDDEIPFVMEWR